jgi:hypothetical protein
MQGDIELVDMMRDGGWKAWEAPQRPDFVALASTIVLTVF